jgi:hypothetical protein
MKLFTIIAWACGICASLIIVLGAASLVFNKSLFGLVHVVNYYHVASSLLLLAILCVLAKQGCEAKKG